jgi:hypothetical protein
MQHQPIDLAALDALELLGNLPMQRRGLIARVSKFSEGD